MNKLVLLLVSCLTLWGCTQNDIVLSDYSIKSGSSFGMCVGECYQELAINEYQAVLRVADLNRQNYDDPEIKATRPVTKDEWNVILQKVDEDVIHALPEVIGCPDCADGGAEWIEIQKPGLNKKITFEYGQPPAELSEVANLLREIRTELNSDK